MRERVKQRVGEREEEEEKEKERERKNRWDWPGLSKQVHNTK